MLIKFLKNTWRIYKRVLKFRNVIIFWLFIFILNLYSNRLPGANFLDIEVGAGASALSSAFTAYANDSTSLYYNPSSLSLIKNKELGFSASLFYGFLSHYFLGYIHPLKNNQGFGFGLILLDSGEIDITDFSKENIEKKSTENLGSFKLTDLCIIVSFGKKIYNFPLGLSFKFVSEKLYNISAKGFGFDFGTKYSIFESPKITAGFSIRNLGMIKPEDDEYIILPLNFNFGLALNYLKYLILFEVKYPLYSETIFKFGFEYEYPFSPNFKFYPRLGYNTLSRASYYSQNESFTIAGLSGFTFGIGINYKFSDIDSNIDYVIIPHSDLGNVHKISLNLKF